MENNEAGPFGDIEKIAKKSLTKPKKHAQKIFGQGRDSNPRSSAWQTKKGATSITSARELVWHSLVLVHVSL